MSRLCFTLLLCVVLLGLLCLTDAEESKAESREKREVPNWALTSSDFFGWIEELRSHGGYDKIEELARTFWAHFPSASRLGYDPPAPEE
ncbi:otospiralin-like [Triplophysa dalaica]|uniref:otospiralin-like n=1 Tax=Triplophysa dalaica TaxID=1582913 RepID=UPI0024DF39D0|nr:otospiralin-like [Triplophysa dalaica]